MELGRQYPRSFWTNDRSAYNCRSSRHRQRSGCARPCLTSIVRQKMNSYSELLRKALVEFHAYAASEKAKTWPAAWFVEMQRLLAIAAAEEDDSGAERVMETIGYSVSDSGPVDQTLSPSLEAARIAVYKKK